MKQCKPNVILIGIQATDTRFNGENSAFVKGLRAIKNLNVIDTQHPNVVVAITWCCSLPCKNVQKWQSNISKKCVDIKKLINDTLKVAHVPVVCIENDIEGNELEMSEDKEQSLLPDKTLQPNNIFLAIAELLRNNNDDLGLMAFKKFFSISTAKERKNAEKRLSIPAKIAADQELDGEERRILKEMINTANQGLRLNQIENSINEYVDRMGANISEVCNQLI